MWQISSNMSELYRRHQTMLYYAWHSKTYITDGQSIPILIKYHMSLQGPSVNLYPVFSIQHFCATVTVRTRRFQIVCYPFTANVHCNCPVKISPRIYISQPSNTYACSGSRLTYGMSSCTHVPLDHCTALFAGSVAITVSRKVRAVPLLPSVQNVAYDFFFNRLHIHSIS